MRSPEELQQERIDEIQKERGLRAVIKRQAKRIAELEEKNGYLKSWGTNQYSNLKADNERLRAENRALRSAFASLRDRLTELSLNAEDAVIAINMDSAALKESKP